MTDRPVISVIIPVYNIKEYLEKAVDSICSQTLTDWEMYLIDDGSTDGSGELCDTLAYGDTRIHVLHQENQGAAAARNRGIENASGKYLYFMDGDDWAASDMLYEMVCIAEHYSLDAWAGFPMNNQGRRLSSIGVKELDPGNFQADVPEEKCAQMVVAGFYIETYYTDTEYYIQKQAAVPKVFADREEFRENAHELFDKNLLYTPWNKLYLTSYIREQGILFKNVHWDDFPFNVDVIKQIDRVSVTDKAFYHFIRKRQDSESEKYNVTLYEEREAENLKLIHLYENWAREEQLALIRKMKSEHTDAAASSGTQTSEQQSGLSEESVDEHEQSQTFASETSQGQNSTQTSSALQINEPSFNFLDKDSSSVPVVSIPSAPAREFLARRYLERVIGCVENVTNPACDLSKKEKRSEIKEMICKESVRQALAQAKPRSLYMKAMLIPIRLKSPALTYLEGTVISKMKIKNRKLFASLKNNR